VSEEARGAIACFVIAFAFATAIYFSTESPVSKILLPKHLNNHTLEVEWLDGQPASKWAVKGRPGIVAEGRMLGFQPAEADEGDKTYIMLHCVRAFKVLGPPEAE